MQQLKDRVAVVTGAASGIGQGLAERFAAEGMKVVLADVEEPALARAAAAIEDKGGTVLSVLTDVSSYEAVERLADQAFEAFGAVHVLCNNAGVAFAEGRSWEVSVRDWEWTVGVNLLSVGYGIRAFVPRMLAGGEEGHVINTASIDGLFSRPSMNIYGATKHAVVRLTEGLHYELREAGSLIHVSVLCPGMTATRILDATRNRPQNLENDPDEAQVTQTREFPEELAQRFRQHGMPPSELAGMVVDAIRSESFYVLGDPTIKTAVQKRMEDILEERVPEPTAPGA